jgi:hypothetical protein
MKRRAFILNTALTMPMLKLWTNYPVNISVPIERIINSVRMSTNFNLDEETPLTFDLTINYKDGGSRDFTSEKIEWTGPVKEPSGQACVIKDKEILLYHKTKSGYFLCTVLDIKEVFDEA